VFTARYGLISYIKKITFRLSKVKLHLVFAALSAYDANIESRID